MGKKKQDAPRNNHVSTVPKKTAKTKLKKKEYEEKILQPFGSFGNHSKAYVALAILLATCAGILHSAHVSRMFENERFFSHLSTLERELSFRTEMGLYYSYYKTIVEAPTFWSGVHAIMNCNITEYPQTTNTLKRFNLYPEVLLAAGYRLYIWVANTFEIQTKVCYQVNRGYNLPPVESCEGMGELSFFYVYPIFYLSGITMFCFFLLCFYLSGSIWGGIIGITTYFYNHGEATRVMWTPPLRESFSFPLLVVQLLSVTIVLKHPKPNWYHTCLILITTLGFMLPWQFAQFVLLTQTCALFGLYALRFITAKKICCILYGLFIAHVANYVCQFGNSMLLSSFFMAAVISVLVISNLELYIFKLPNIILIWAVQGSVFLVGTFGIKFLTARLLNIKDDAHIVDILKSKFTSYKDFHTLLYTCAPEFNFIEIETFYKLSKTLLLPCALLGVTAILFKIIKFEIHYWLLSKDDETPNGAADNEDDEIPLSNLKPYAEHFYHVLQASAFIIIAILIMRLKLFGTPALCIMASMVASRQYFSFVGSKTRHQAILVVILAMMSVQGIANLRIQFNTSGEYNNPHLEELISWIETKTSKFHVFAGSMPTMATVKLTTKRPIVNHPHYEDAGLRERTKKVYQMYSRKPCEESWKSLIDMGVNYIIIEKNWCFGRSKQGCSMPDIWDVEDIKNRGRPSCCSILFKKIEEGSHVKPFQLVFRNDDYTVFRT
ncbi:probable C-mannosyltransferase DPY19L1 [Dendronephthya gigantea]|uniref:probable C-mannosyltransferase DPY19L1 n=1 Tax=Dendronephthya gigantea TaxID=151771 RepID=UPI00106C2D65|nr:probable C-mannosyltransferase DPY19L1 [Dendronephthya gigantea]